jgi:hypothetical protein
LNELLCGTREELTPRWKVKFPSAVVTDTTQQPYVSERFSSRSPFIIFLSQHFFASCAPSIGTIVSGVSGPPKPDRLSRMKTLNDVLTDEGFLLISMRLTMDFTLVITHFKFRITLRFSGSPTQLRIKAAHRPESAASACSARLTHKQDRSISFSDFGCLSQII